MYEEQFKNSREEVKGKRITRISFDEEGATEAIGVKDSIDQNMPPVVFGGLYVPSTKAMLAEGIFVVPGSP